MSSQYFKLPVQFTGVSTFMNLSLAFELYTDWSTWSDYEYMKVYQRDYRVIAYEFKFYEFTNNADSYNNMTFELYLTNTTNTTNPGTTSEIIYFTPAVKNYQAQTKYSGEKVRKQLLLINSH